MDKIEFSLENGEKTEFYVLEQTRLGGCDYILVTDTVDEEEGEALILKDIPLLKIKMPSMKSWMTNANWMRWQKFFPICWMISTWKNNPGVCAVRRFYIGEAFLPAAIFR